MSDCSPFARRPHQPAAYEMKIVNWMAEHRHPGYATSLRALTDEFDEIVAEAGPGGNHCEFTQERLDKIDTEIKETCQRAVDRYEDWASDPLP